MNRAALIQMVSSSKIDENLNQVKTFLQQAKEQGAQLAVLPENFAFMGPQETDKLEVAERFGQGPIQDKMSKLSKKMGLWVIAGTIPLKGAGSKVRASCLVFDDKGKNIARYDKTHLFDVRVSDHEAHKESITTERGDELVVVDTPIGKVGLTVCYDLRFPELFTQLQMKGVEIYSVPSAFTAVTGMAHWEVLLRARAIENLSYVLAPNQGGIHENGRHTYGHSMAVEPWGKIIAHREAGSGVTMVDIDLHKLHQLRKQFPCNDHHILLTKLSER